MTVTSDFASTAARTAQNKKKPVSLYYNPDSGSSAKVLKSIRNDERIRLEATQPLAMKQTIKRAVEQGAKRVLISNRARLDKWAL